MPPDLSLIARVRGSDWIYTYLKSFYLDESRPLGWNNKLFPNASMPNPLWQMQGLQHAEYGEPDKATGDRPVHGLKITQPGTHGAGAVRPGRRATSPPSSSTPANRPPSSARSSACGWSCSWRPSPSSRTCSRRNTGRTCTERSPENARLRGRALRIWTPGRRHLRTGTLGSGTVGDRPRGVDGVLRSAAHAGSTTERGSNR